MHLRSARFRAIFSAARSSKANAAEASALTAVDVCDLESAREAAVRLMAIGAEGVTLEAGRAGNLFVSRSEEVFLPRPDVASVDESGAGDALVGAFAMAMVEGSPLREAAIFASAAAALATRSPGAQTALPARAELERWRAAHVNHGSRKSVFRANGRIAIFRFKPTTRN